MRSNARPAATVAKGLKDRHAFKAEMDDEARKIMFKHWQGEASSFSRPLAQATVLGA